MVQLPYSQKEQERESKIITIGRESSTISNSLGEVKFGPPQPFPNKLVGLSPRMPIEEILIDHTHPKNKEWLIDTCLEIARADKLDESAVAAGMISASVASLNRTICIYEKPDFQIWASGGIILVGASGERKGRIQTQCMQPIFDAEEELYKIVAPDERKREYKLGIATTRLKKMHQINATGNKSTKELSIISLAEDIETSPEEEKLIETIAKLSQVFHSDFTVNVITTEKLEDKVSFNGHRYVWTGAESDDALKVQIFAKYTKANSSVQFMLSSLNPYPERHQSERFGRNIKASVCGNCFICMQPSGYLAFVQSPELMDKGVGARFGFIFMKRLAGTREEKIGERPLDLGKVQTYWDRIKAQAVHLPDPKRRSHRYGYHTPGGIQADIMMVLDKDATELRRQYNNYLEKEKLPGGRYHKYIADMNKSVSQSVIWSTGIQAVCTENFSQIHNHWMNRYSAEQGILFQKFLDEGALLHKDFEEQQKIVLRGKRLLRAISTSSKFDKFVKGQTTLNFYNLLTRSWSEDPNMRYVLPMLKELNYIHYEGAVTHTKIYVRPDLKEIEVWDV